MLFKRRRRAPDAPSSRSGPSGEAVHEAERVNHRGYAIIPRTKQLHSGRWIVRILLEEPRPEGPRRYDFAGPMAEYATRDAARDAGIEYAKERVAAHVPRS